MTTLKNFQEDKARDLPGFFMLDLSIIVVSYNTKALTLLCLKSLNKISAKTKFEVIVVDNNSKDDSPLAIKKMKLRGAEIRLIENKENRGFAAANNQGFSVSKGKYVLLLNSDTLLKTDAVAPLIKWMESHPDVGIATVSLLNPDRTTQATGGYFPSLLRVCAWALFLDDLPLLSNLIRPYHPHTAGFLGGSVYKKDGQLDWVTGAFLLTRKEIIEKIGLFDEKYFMYVEEVDFCFRVKKLGYKVWYLSQFQIFHKGRASSSSETAILGEFKGLKLFYKKHFPAWQYPLFLLTLKLAAFSRIIVFGILKGPDGIKYAKIYFKAFFAD